MSLGQSGLSPVVSSLPLHFWARMKIPNSGSKSAQNTGYKINALTWISFTLIYFYPKHRRRVLFPFPILSPAS